MIKLTRTPVRADYKAEYIVKDDMLTVKINDVEEIFDFTGLEEGVAEEIIVEELPINPIISVEKIDNTVNVTVIRFYGEEEKSLFEVVQNGEN